MGGRREGVAWALLGVVLFSFSVPLTKVAVEGFDPFLTAMGRAVIAGAIAVVLLDATVIRAVLLPAAMKLLGDWNWYLPNWLNWLPRLEHGNSVEPAASNTPRALPHAVPQPTDA